MDGYRHYIRLNEAGTIVYGFSSAFEEPLEGDICINEDAPRHFQEAFTEPLTDSRGIYLFKYVGGQIMPRTSQEIDADVQPIPKSEVELLKEDNAQMTTQIIELWETLISLGVV